MISRRTGRGEQGRVEGSRGQLEIQSAIVKDVYRATSVRQ